MKKIILILFLFFLCLSCYYIYQITEPKNTNITAIGDSLANIKDIDKTANFNNQFTNKDYRIIDILNILKYNEEKDDESLHRLLNNTDTLIISVGMNDIYYKINDNTKEIYTYLNNLINEYEELLKGISKYDYQNVYVMGYYNITSKDNDLFTYVNYKLNKVVNTYNYTFLDLNKTLYDNPKFYLKNNEYYLNNEGYKQILKLIVEKTKKS